MMYVAALNGASIAELAAQYELGEQRVAAILLAERHKFQVSPAAAYKEMRARAQVCLGASPLH
jgi:hypothetical protein